MVLRQAADSVSAWADGSLLKLNQTKSHAILIDSHRFTSDFFGRTRLCIELSDGTHIPFVDSIRSLGVILDLQLSWKYHVYHISKTVLYSLRFFRKFTTEALRKRFAEALLFPHLESVMLKAAEFI